MIYFHFDIGCSKVIAFFPECQKEGNNTILLENPVQRIVPVSVDEYLAGLQNRQDDRRADLQVQPQKNNFFQPQKNNYFLATENNHFFLGLADTVPLCDNKLQVINLYCDLFQISDEFSNEIKDDKETEDNVAKGNPVEGTIKLDKKRRLQMRNQL